MYSETSGESNYGYITLFFLWSFRPNRVPSTSICLLSKLGHFLGGSHLEKTRLSSKAYFCEARGDQTKKVKRAEIFRLDTSINTLSTVKFSNLYLALIKSYESLKLSKMLIFAYIWRFIKCQRLSVES